MIKKDNTCEVKPFEISVDLVYKNEPDSNDTYLNYLDQSSERDQSIEIDLQDNKVTPKVRNVQHPKKTNKFEFTEDEDTIIKAKLEEFMKENNFAIDNIR